MIRVRRVITGHDRDGKAIVIRDDHAPPQGRGVLVWSTSTLPPNNAEEYDGTVGTIVANQPTGTNLNMWTFPPGHVSAMHRTDPTGRTDEPPSPWQFALAGEPLRQRQFRHSRAPAYRCERPLG